MNKLTVIIPCRNEAATLGNLIARLINCVSSLELEIIIVDDASSDKTTEVIGLLRTKYSNVIIHEILNETKQGIYACWKQAIDISTGHLVLLMDGDLQNPPESIPGMLDLIERSGADIVQAVRRVIDEDSNNTIKRARTNNFLVRILFHLECRDATSGFLLGTSYGVRKLFEARQNLFYSQSHLYLFAKFEGLEVQEIETLFDKREATNTSPRNRELNFIEFAKFTFDLFRLKLYEFRNGSFYLGGVRSNYKTDLPLLRRFFFWLYFKSSIFHKWIIRSSIRDKYNWLKTVEYFDREDLKNIQLLRLKKLIKHVYLNVPYYRAEMDRLGLSFDFIETLDDFENFPLLSKADVRSNIHFQMFAVNHDKKIMHKIKTSGSTGEPFICYADKFQLEMRMASTIRAFEMTGWAFGDKQLRLWHQTLGMSKSQVVKERIDALFMRRKFVPAFEMSEKSLTNLQNLIRRKKPALIDGYAESLNFLASKSFDYGSYSPKGLISSAQQLTPNTRENIERSFSSRVHDKYGSREFSGIAYQCKESPYHHVQDESYIVEILVEGRPAKPGELGEIVITDLNNFSVPLIRYRIGDMAYAVEQLPCKCGRSQTLIGDIAGRTQALVACSNGVWLPGTFFAHFFKDFNWCISQYQVFQREIGEITLRIVSNGAFLEEEKSKISELLSQYVGESTKINFEIVDEIPLLATGKRTPVISLVRVDFQSLESSSIRNKEI